MGTQCKLYTNAVQPIPPNVWTTIKFDVVLRDDDLMYQGDETVTNPNSALIKPRVSGDFIWSSLVKFDTITVPDGDEAERQFNVRFVRNPYTTPDNTGEADGDDTVGQDLRCTTWQFRGNAGQPVAIEVRHTHTEPVNVIHAQFVATTWDY